MFSSVCRRNLFVPLRRVGIKVANVLVILAMLMPNFASIGAVQAASEDFSSDTLDYSSPLAIPENTYQAPVFEHPEPRINTSRTEYPSSLRQTSTLQEFDYSCYDSGIQPPAYDCDGEYPYSHWSHPYHSRMYRAFVYDITSSDVWKKHVHTVEIGCTGTEADCPEIQTFYYHAKVRNQWSVWISGASPPSDVSLEVLSDSVSTQNCGAGTSGNCDDLVLAGVAEVERRDDGENQYKYYLSFNNTVEAPYSLHISRYWDVQVTADLSLVSWGIDNDSVTSACTSDKGPLDGRECEQTAAARTQGTVGDPINTRTGGFDYSIQDISFNTSAGSLGFQRTYSSKTIDTYSLPLGPGWTHNHDTHLIFPEQDDGEIGKILFKAHTSNRYTFYIGEDSYIAAPGVQGSLVKNIDSTYTLRTPSQSIYDFDENGRLQTWTNKNGNAFIYSYDEYGRLEQVSANNEEYYLHFGYDAENRIISVGDHAGRSVHYGYDQNGDLTSFTDVLGNNSWQYAYDENHNLTNIDDPNTKIETVYAELIPEAVDFNNHELSSYLPTFFSVDNSVAQIEDDGQTLHLSGDGWKELAYPYQITNDTVLEFDFKSDAEGKSHGIALGSINTLLEIYGSDARNIYDFDIYDDNQSDWKHYKIRLGEFYNGEIPGIIFVNEKDELNPAAESCFSNLKIYEDHGIRAIAQYDAAGELIAELGLDENSQIISTDANGAKTVHSYNGLGILNAEKDPAGNTSNKTYDLNFRPATITDENENVTQLTWSEDGTNLTDIVDANENETSIVYDALNNPVSVTNADGFLTTYTYEGTLLSSVEDTLGGETSYTYTAEGYLETVSDPLGNETSYTYDEYGQRVSMTNSLGAIWYYSYDDLGRLIETTDPLGYVSHNEYDDAGRLLQTIQNYAPGCQENCEEYNISTEYTYDTRGNQTSVTDTLGRTTTYAYDINGRLLIATDPAGNQTQNQYDAAGQLIETEDSLGRITKYEYDENGRIISTEDPEHNLTTTTYNPDGTVEYTMDARGHSTYYEYDELKRVVATEDELGNRITSEYDALGNLVRTTDKLGSTTQYEYDALGRVIRQTNPDGGETETFYDEAGNRVQFIDALGNTTTYEYDEANRLIYVTDTLGNITEFEYDLLGRRTAVIDANENRTEYVYDALGRTVTVIDPLGNESTTEYDPLGNATVRTDPLGAQTSYSYDLLNRLLSQIDPLEGEVSYEYDAIGNQLSVTNQNHFTSSTEYDALNRPIEYTDAKGATVYQEYDEVGNLIYVEDTFNNITTYAYDELNRQTEVNDPLEHRTTYEYDANGNRVGVTDANGNSTRYEYDSMGRFSAAVENYKPGFEADEETNIRTEYTYDENGNLLTITDGNGHVSSFEYDELNRLTNESDPLGNSWVYGYDAVGNRVSMYDANGWLTTYQYDENNQLVSIDYPDDDLDVSFEYDEAGRRISMQDGLGATGWEYDDLNRPTGITDPFGATVSYDYDAVGNRTKIIYPNGEGVTYEYDATNLLEQVTDWDDASTSYSYDLIGRMTGVDLPNGISSSYSYNDAGYLTNIQHQNGDTTLSSFQYTYDNVGNRTQAQEYFGGTNAAGPTVLITATNSSGDVLTNKPVYVFDGNTYTGFTRNTDVNGQASITLPEGNYRFRLDVDGTQFWSHEENHCQIAGCTDVMMTIPEPVLINVQDSEGSAVAGIQVYAFTSETYSGYNGTTDENGQLSMRLPEGNYHFRADFNGAQFWSNEESHCETPGCTIASIDVTLPVTVSVSDHLDMPQAGVTVYAFSGATYSGYNAVTDENGQVELTLPRNNYHFRADFNGTQFWSSDENDCAVPECNSAAVTVTQPVTVSVQNTNGDPLTGIKVYAFNGTTYSGFNQTSDENGTVQFTLPVADYRFRADLNGTQFWSAAENHCTVPDCGSASVTVSTPLTVTVQDTDGAVASGLKVYAFDGTEYSGFNQTTDETGQVNFTLPLGSYRFRVDLNGTQFWSASANHCDVPGCEALSVAVTKPVTVTVFDGEGTPWSGIKVYAFDGTDYSGYNQTTDENGAAVFSLLEGDYRFRADHDGTQYWSAEENHCTLPSCETVDMALGEIVAPTPTQIPATETPIPEPTNTPVPPTPTPTEMPDQDIVQEDFEDEILDSAWEWYVPLEGPEYSLADNPGYLQVSIPIHYDHWVGTDNSPQMRRTDMGQENWAIETYLEQAESNIGDQWQVNLMAGYGQYDQQWLSIDNYENLHVTRVGNSDTALIGGITLPLYLRIEKEDSLYTFKYKENEEDEWQVAGTSDVPEEAVQYVGLQFRTFYTSVGAAVFDIDYFKLERWETIAEPMMMPQSMQSVEKVIPEESETPEVTNTPTPTSTPTPTPTVTATPEGSALTTGMGKALMRGLASNIWNSPEAQTSQVMVTVQDSDGAAAVGLKVYAFDGTSYTGVNGTTDENGQVRLTLPAGDYRFRADLNGTQFWSAAENNCTAPDCTEVAMTVTKPLSVTVLDSSGTPAVGLKVYAFDGTTYAGYNKTTDENGQAIFTLPEGDYRFRADLNGTQFWSGAENHCSLPGCEAASVIVTIPMSVTVTSTEGVPQEGIKVYAFSGTVYAGYNQTTDKNGLVSFTLSEGDYRFRADTNGTQFWSGEENHCTLPGCTSASVTVTSPLTVTVTNTGGLPQAGLKVYAFDGSTYSGFNATTDANGQVQFTLLEGNYRFRADLDGTQFWSAEENHCTVPECESASVVVTGATVVHVQDTDGVATVGLNVYAFDGETYSGFNGATDENGDVEFTLPEGNYRFRADLNDTQFWSGDENHCAVPGCEAAAITVTSPLTVYVDGLEDGEGEGIHVYAFDGETYSGFNGVTDASGAVEFTLPEGEYRFRADFNGTQFWSGEENHCAVPGCEDAIVTVTQPMTVTVKGQAGTVYPEVNVYAFSGDTYSGYNGVTDDAGQVSFTLPAGDYHFRADYDGVQFWSSTENDCTVPGCAAISIVLPEVAGEINTVIDYVYDSLYRLTEANYDNGDYYQYAYDAVGNRLSKDSSIDGLDTQVSYAYDDANRMIDVGGVTYTYDANGNLLNDGTITYDYDWANRLTSYYGGEYDISYSYNGLGDRHQIIVDPSTGSGTGVTTNYTLDLAAGLTQVLDNGTNTYLYGNGRIAQAGSTTEYFLGDALGSVRQLADPAGAVTLTQSYAPYGEVTQSVGTSQTNYAFTGESRDANGLTYLRARYLDSSTGRFTQRDPSGLEANLYLYAGANPINRIDPTGLFSPNLIARSYGETSFEDLLDAFENQKDPFIGERWGWLALLLDSKPGDEFKASQVDLMRLYPDFVEHHRGFLFIDNSGDIKANITSSFAPADPYRPGVYTLRSLLMLQNSWNSRLPRGSRDIPFWRDASPHLYMLGTRSYIDYKQVQNDYPDLRSLEGAKPSYEFKLGIGVGGSTVVDRFGNIYVAGSLGAGASIGVGAYSESYIEPFFDTYFYTGRSTVPSEEQIKAISFCASISGNGLFGYSGTLCPYDGGYSLPFVAGISTYRLGAIAGVSTEWGYSRRVDTDRAMGWDWARTYRNNGITRADVERKALLQLGNCGP